MSETASQLDTARTVVAVVVGAAAVIGVVVVLVVIALYREKRIRAELTRQADALTALQVRGAVLHGWVDATASS